MPERTNNGSMTADMDRTVRRYRAAFEAFGQDAHKRESSALQALRHSAMDAFASAGFPTTRNEEWRFTNVSAMEKIDFQPVLRAAPIKGLQERIAGFLLEGVAHLVFIDGQFSPDCSDLSRLPQGVTVASLSDALRRESNSGLPIGSLTASTQHPFALLNTAFIRDGAVIRVADGLAVERPVQICFVATGTTTASLIQPRNFISAGAGSKCSIVETSIALAEGQYLTNAVTELLVANDAEVIHDRVVEESDEAFHVSYMQVRVERGGRYTSNVVNLGGAIIRNDLRVQLAGENAECTLNGLSLGTGTQLVDNHTVIDHSQPQGRSHELYKSILAGRSRGVFNGKIFVHQDAQKTDSKQTNRTLLLSDDATINTKPQLEIFADDVKCTHGAAVGQLDEEQVFYLRSRGIPENGARDILTEAFATEILNRIGVQALRERLEPVIRVRLEKGRKS